MEKKFPTGGQLSDLANRLRAAYREACEHDECDCITIEQHEKMLATNRQETELDG